MQVNRWVSNLDIKPSECSSLTYEIHTNVLLQEMNAVDEATEQCVPTSPGAVVPRVASELLLLYVSSMTIQKNCDMDQVAKICGYMENLTKS